MTMRDRRAAEERLTLEIERRHATCGVIGLGFIGSVLMDALTHAGFRTRGFDRSAGAVDRFQEWMTARHGDPDATWTAGTDPDLLADTEVVLVAVRAFARPDRSVDLEPVESAASILRGYPRTPRLVLLESTVPCGVTRCFAASLQSAPCVFVAHSPERLSVGHDREVLRRVPHLIGGVDEASGRLGARLLESVCDRVVRVSTAEVSELSKLLENAFLTTGIALSNEVTSVAHAIGISAEEVCAAAATKSFGYHPFFPGPGMGGHCLENDLAILLSATSRFGVTLPLMHAVDAAATEGPHLVLRRLEQILCAHGRDLEGLRVLLVGVGFKPGTADTTGSPAREIARLLHERGAGVSYLDGLVSRFFVDDRPLGRVHADELGQGAFDVAIVVAGDRSASLDRLAACTNLVFDARGRTSEPRPEGVHTL
jgi:UDP-N-acetyl-D-glucosamine dehydrogenase